VEGNGVIQNISAYENHTDHYSITNGMSEVLGLLRERTSVPWWKAKKLVLPEVEGPIRVATQYLKDIGFRHLGRTECRRATLQQHLEGDVAEDMDSTLDISFKIFQADERLCPRKRESFSLLTLSISGGGEIPLNPSDRRNESPSGMEFSLCRRAIEQAARRLGLYDSQQLSLERVQSFAKWNPFISPSNLIIKKQEPGVPRPPVRRRPASSVPSLGAFSSPSPTKKVPGPVQLSLFQ
jgi:hypothetical protein